MVRLRNPALAALGSLLAAHNALSIVFAPILGTDRPFPAGGSIAVDQPPNYFFQGFSPPFPTNDGWIGYGAGTGDATKGAITFFAGKALGVSTSATVSAAKFQVVNSTGTYVIYSLSGVISLTASNTGTITAGGKFTGILRVVKLNAPGHEVLLDQYYANYPTGVSTDYEISGLITGILYFESLRVHENHRSKLQSPNFPSTTSLSYLTTKGYMYPAIGNIWNLCYDLPTITWHVLRTPDASCRASLVAGLEYEIAHLPAVAQPGDFYFFGGHVAMVSRLALIAEQVGRNDLVSPVVNYLESMFGYLFNSASTAVPAYETAWGGIINRAGYNNI
ncbi:hypothetical protein H0H81_012202 [Sphagnurus paluster]|uniref:Glycosyl hydrolase family 81 N-terminal domain-containing protein n=1 Tax=Sphagnurus paluster TaxID=117069 RepID=A0A9P7GKY9_9AGAR|nr:hypothetical protein H0H81_012202 [Sphagnurus paluster]